MSASFRLALAARIRSLSPAARDSLALLALVGQAERALLGDGVDELIAREFADEADGAVAIRHALFAEVAVDELEDAAPVHARLAERVADRAEAAHHLAAAGRPERAAPLALAAAEEAATQPERAELLALAARCEPSTELALRAGRALEECGLYGEAERTIKLVFPLSGRERAQAACLLWNIRYELGDLDGAAAEVAAGSTRRATTSVCAPSCCSRKRTLRSSTKGCAASGCARRRPPSSSCATTTSCDRGRAGRTGPRSTSRQTRARSTSSSAPPRSRTRAATSTGSSVLCTTRSRRPRRTHSRTSAEARTQGRRTST